MKPLKVAFCIPTYGSQPPNFWGPLAAQFAEAHKFGVDLVGPLTESSMAADRNRNALVRRALATDAEWTYWQDADNINPAKTLKRLLETAGQQRTMVCGLYYMKKAPYRPVAYRRLADGRYAHIEGWERGEILEIDAAGMNCVLIHRSVFEAIDEQFVVLQRAAGGIVPVHREDIEGDVFDQASAPGDGKVIEGVWQQRVQLPSEPVEVPFFYLEYNRTEDIAFFEMAKRAGQRLFVDTSVECGHLDWRVVSGADYRRAAGGGQA